ncbi:MAG TPA: putative protein N(5)-glutamine methyltransferase [Actinotalea sp.]
MVGRLRAAGCVFAEDEAQLLLEAASSDEQLADMVGRRVDGFPLEQILGWAEFSGLRILVDPGVFVPRRRTELLVTEALRLVTGRPAGAAPLTVVDLCCGSGALGVALTSALPEPVDLHAADIDPAAVRCARRNVEPVGGQVHEGDLFAALPVTLRGRVDLLLANTPYVPHDAIATLPPEARLHEPAQALDGGGDGLDVQRRVVAAAIEWLAPGGHLLVETSEEQAPVAMEVFRAAGLEAHVRSDEERGATVVVGTRAAAARP